MRAALAVWALALGAQEEAREFHFQHENVLGTSLDLVVQAPTRARAEACQAAVLDEIERLRRILSTYDPASEVSRLNGTPFFIRVSAELMEVLALYEAWRLRSGGAFNGQLGSIICVWKKAQESGTPPEDALLDRLARAIDGPAADLDVEGGKARRRTSQLLNVNAIGKNYIIEKAVHAARSQDPSLAGILLSIGGDVACRGAEWRVGVVDPRRSQDNAPPLTHLLLRDRAVASSGSYERPYTIGDRRHSPVMDPRNGRPADGVLGATVVAPDAVTADALSTALCVLGPREGLALVARVARAECLIVASDGTVHTSPGWAALEAPGFPVEIAQQKHPAWPEKFQVGIDVMLAQNPPGKPYCRPYLAVWVEDASKKPVRTISVWGTDAKYLKELTAWWSFAGKDGALVKAVTRATRNPGKHTLLWDGLDDKGQPVPQGVYVLRVEVHREHGRHIKDMVAPLACRAKAWKGDLRGNVEIESIKVRYGPEGK